ncbi:MAG TPA: PEGA domain-containing protein, partial [Polyangia bacterium]|nr:PEGA domain-containing protein [Polyangia bacterium]
MTSRSLFFARFALATCVAFCAAPAIAADGSPAPAASAPSPAVKAEARERFDTGLHLFEKGENAGALAEFKRAYQLIPNPLVLYNMGLVYAAMSRPVDAVDALNQFIGDPGEANAEQRTHAEQTRVEQTKRIAQLVILTDHPATIEVDGVEVGRTPLAKPIRVASGSHVVAVEAPGFLGSRREVTLAGQITETIAMGMESMDTRMAQLVVTATVPGAEVVVNGKRVGATPLPASVAVPPGKVTVELQRAGYLTASQTISLDEGARGEL